MATAIIGTLVIGAFAAVAFYICKQKKLGKSSLPGGYLRVPPTISSMPPWRPAALWVERLRPRRRLNTKE